MLNRMWVLMGCLFLGLAWAGTSIWSLNQSPASDTFNGISAPNSDFAIAVGENGSIVHFIDGDNGTLMPSGTTEELYDVYASSPDLAVATGEDVVLLWDGVSWSTLVTNTNDTIYTGTWISPEEDIIFYGSIASGFGGFVCPKIPNDETPLFCRGFLNELMLTACGNSNDIKLFTTSGDIYHVNNFLGDVNGPDPIHDEPSSLSLGGVWVPEGACVAGPFAPLEAFAIKNFPSTQLWHFNGVEWINMNVSIPADQTFTWIGGASSNDITAVGFKPDGVGGNEGVVWNYDGTTWTEDINLPPGTPGLTDIAFNVSAPDFIFMGGFELSVNRMNNGELATTDTHASGEAGFTIKRSEFFSPSYTDIMVEKTRLTNGPFRNGDSISYQIKLKNEGLVTATDFHLIDSSQQMDYISDTCSFIQFGTFSEWDMYSTRVASLAPTEVMTCTITLIVNGQVGDEIKNSAEALEVDDYKRSNNHSSSENVFIQAPL